MAWGAVLFYGHGLASGSGGHYAVNGMESFAVFAAVPGQVLASLLMWLAVRSYVRTPPSLPLIVALLLAGHVAGIVMSALFAEGMLLYAPLLWLRPRRAWRSFFWDPPWPWESTSDVPARRGYPHCSPQGS